MKQLASRSRAVGAKVSGKFFGCWARKRAEEYEPADADGVCCGAGGGTMKRLASCSREVGAQVSGSTAVWPLVVSTLVICWRE